MGTHVAAGKREWRTPRSGGGSNSPTYRQDTLPGDCADRSRLSTAMEDVLARTFGQKARAAWPTPLAQHAAPGRCGGQKNGGACGTAKFREETSKKADSATRGRIAAVHNVGGRIVRLQVIFCNAAFTNAGHGGYSTGSHPHLHSRKFRERRPHPATKAGCCRSGGRSTQRGPTATRRGLVSCRAEQLAALLHPPGRLTP